MNSIDSYTVEKLAPQLHNERLHRAARERRASEATGAQVKPHSTISLAERIGGLIAAVAQAVSWRGVQST